MGPEFSDRGDRTLFWVYLATPLFWLADLTLGWTFRIAGLELPAQRSGYYLILTLLAGLLWWQPLLVRLVALIEPAVNIGLLMVSAWIAIIGSAELAIEGRTPEIFTIGRLINFLISGSMLSFAVHQAIDRLRPTA